MGSVWWRTLAAHPRSLHLVPPYRRLVASTRRPRPVQARMLQVTDRHQSGGIRERYLEPFRLGVAIQVPAQENETNEEV